MRKSFIKAFKIINGISNYGRYFPTKWKFTVKVDFKIKSISYLLLIVFYIFRTYNLIKSKTTIV